MKPRKLIGLSVMKKRKNLACNRDCRAFIVTKNNRCRLGFEYTRYEVDYGIFKLTRYRPVDPHCPKPKTNKALKLAKQKLKENKK